MTTTQGKRQPPGVNQIFCVPIFFQALSHPPPSPVMFILDLLKINGCYMHFGVIQSFAFPMISFIARHFLMEKCPFVFLELLGMER